MAIILGSPGCLWYIKHRFHLFHNHNESKVDSHPKPEDPTADAANKTRTFRMKPITVFGLLVADLVSAVDMSPYKAGTGVEAEFATFVEE